MAASVVEIAGTKLRVTEAGSGPPLLYLHGRGGSNWTPLLDRLSENWRVIAPEHPGFGRSSIPDWMMSVGDLAFFYLDFLETLDLRRVHLAGHSLGGWIAAELAIRSTGRLASLALLAPFGVLAEDAPYDDIFAMPPEEIARRMFYDQALAEARIAALPNADLDTAIQNATAVARVGWSPRLHNPQLRHWLHRIDVPTLVAWGVEDRIAPFACHAQFVAEIAGAELFALEQSGHALPQERPREVAQRLNDFYDRVRS
jgi:pimeloyl-ACP methyl ester carboxylesterase